MADATLFVCTTCQIKSDSGDSAKGPRPGQRLFDDLQNQNWPDGVEIQAVECLSACDFGCNIALTGPGRWSYVYSRLDPQNDIAQIVEGVTAYAASDDGIVPWRQRPRIFRKQSIARIPPTESR